MHSVNSHRRIQIFIYPCFVKEISTGIGIWTMKRMIIVSQTNPITISDIFAIKQIGNDWSIILV